ncbi:hypothetical protein ZHAS_00004290 [Anopheles sinensis]|uniref:Uncharacterized protein n=1 Tax=Anopheles sinensis TaxID=74873 RepID=A0A084VGI9_ANOSI|nr:hypothetical protein ZHAS_00004290 [Anopheles sinensis]
MAMAAYIISPSSRSRVRNSTQNPRKGDAMVLCHLQDATEPPSDGTVFLVSDKNKPSPLGGSPLFPEGGNHGRRVSTGSRTYGFLRRGKNSYSFCAVTCRVRPLGCRAVEYGSHQRWSWFWCRNPSASSLPKGGCPSSTRHDQSGSHTLDPTVAGVERRNCHGAPSYTRYTRGAIVYRAVRSQYGQLARVGESGDGHQDSLPEDPEAAARSLS